VIRIARRVAWTGLLLCLLAVFVAACSVGEEDQEASVQPQGENLVITLGTKDFSESILIGELYRQALEAKGIKVNLRKAIGPTEEIDKELQSGRIDGYPEYLGIAVTVAAGQEEGGSTPEETYQLAKEFYAGRGQAISEQTPFQNVDVIATTQYFAQRRGLATIDDLKRLSRITLGGQAPFATRQQGLVGLREAYGLDNVRFEPITYGDQYEALDRKQIEAANGGSTDGQFASGSYKILDDTEDVFGFQHVALVIDEAKLEELGGRDFMRIIDNVNRRLTTSVMIAMNREVVLDGQDEAVVAERFLGGAGLLERSG
jgi:osmoprotectant transport system substrate-binding protein